MNRVAAIQMVSGDDVGKNLDDAAGLITEAARERCRFVALPEFFAIISEDERAKIPVREPFGKGPLQQFLAEQARANKIWLLGGTIPLACDDPERVCNSSLLFADNGCCMARYDKIHLFDVYVGDDEREHYNESATMKPGSELVLAETPFGRLGLSVCYDLRFPELYRRLVRDGAVMFTVPSAFTARTGSKHWEVLLRARALENLSYVIAPGQGGCHNAIRTTWGHTMIIDPWGEILDCVDSGPGIAIADFDMPRLRQLRGSFPALDHQTLSI